MRGPKLNEKATEVGVRSGTKATAKHVRSSAYKARVVLDLVRGLDVRRADEVLQFTDRGIARDIRKVLASAVANASDTNNGAYIGEPDELFVIACFADEGPTLKRFKSGSRGRANRIRKRTCHITVLVARMSDQRLEVVRARAEGQTRGTAANRRARVERSRANAAAAKSAVSESGAADEIVDEIVDDAADEITVETVDIANFADIDIDTVEAETVDTVEAETVEAETLEAETVAGFAAAEWAGAVLPDADGAGPDTHPIKGNADSMLYHTPESRYYKVTKAEVWFDTEDNAVAAGFAKPAATTTEASEQD